jgi:hypothetical protein
MSEQPEVEDGDQRADAARSATAPVSPWLLIIGGAVAALIGTPLVLNDQVGGGSHGLGLALLAVGSILALVGLIAIGTMLGIARQRCRDEWV